MMNAKKSIVLFFLFSVFCFCNASYGSDFIKNMELSFGAGPSWLHAKNNTIQSAQAETDATVVSNPISTGLVKVGLGYHLFSIAPSQRKFFNDLLLELNFYNQNTSINGTVWQYEDSEFNNYTFRAPLKSTRLMLDLKPSLFRNAYFSFYPIAGIGLSWNKLAYRETPNSQVPSDSYISLQSGLNRRVAYDAGLGARYFVTKHLNVALEYLYNQFGVLSSSKNSIGPVTPLTAAKFSVYSQTLLLSANWHF